MQDSERQKFEENWKSAFDGAGTTPPDRVWNSIELKLAGEESAIMKKRVVFYQRLAAATVLFAILSGVYAFYPRTNETQLASNKVQTENQAGSSKDSEDKVQGAKSNVQSETSGEHVKKNSVPASAITSTSTSFAKSNQPIVRSEPVILIEESKSNETVAFNEPARSSENVTEVIAKSGERNDEKKEEKKAEEQLAVVSPLFQDNPETVVEPKEKKRNTESFWVSLGGSAGNYTPNTASTSTITPTQSFASASLNSGPLKSAPATSANREPKVGTAYSVGMAVGKKFGRFVVQTGVNVGKQQIDYTSNYDNPTQTNTRPSKAAVADYQSYSVMMESSNALAFTNEYTVNSTMEIVSIPVQAGYMIIDRKFGWQLNAGVSTDFFLRNVLVDQSGQRERFTQSAGTESPYRSVNWSGLANTEISYRLGQHYRVSVLPGFRYSFNSILKEPTDNGRPVILDLGFRFKYLFN